MAWCKDARLTYLNNLGYNVVRLPRTGLEALDVLGKDHKTIDRLGTLDKVWQSTKQLPTVHSGAAVGIQGTQTDKIKASIGFDLLGTIIKALGGNEAKLDVAFNNATSVQFKLENVEASGVDPLDVGEFLATGDINPKNPIVARYVTTGDAGAFVVTEVLKSNALTVSGTLDSGATVTLNVPEIQKVVSGQLSVDMTHAATGTVTYTGKQMLTFGFKIFAIALEDGTWQVHGVEPSGNTAAATTKAVRSILWAEGALLDRNF